MKLKEFIGMVVIGRENNRKYILTEITMPTTHAKTVDLNSFKE